MRTVIKIVLGIAFGLVVVLPAALLLLVAFGLLAGIAGAVAGLALVALKLALVVLVPIALVAWLVRTVVRRRDRVETGGW